MLSFGHVLQVARASLFAACSCVPVSCLAKLSCAGPKSANPPARPRPPPAPCRSPLRSPRCTCTRGARSKAQPPNAGPPTATRASGPTACAWRPLPVPLPWPISSNAWSLDQGRATCPAGKAAWAYARSQHQHCSCLARALGRRAHSCHSSSFAPLEHVRATRARACLGHAWGNTHVSCMWCLGGRGLTRGLRHGLRHGLRAPERRAGAGTRPNTHSRNANVMLA
jgi:hypothetical protein